MISIMISGLKYLLALTSYWQKKKVFLITIQEERVFTIMNTNEISGKRQFWNFWKILTISEAELQEKKKQQKGFRKLWTVLAWRVIWKNFLLIPFR